MEERAAGERGSWIDCVWGVWAWVLGGVGEGGEPWCAVWGHGLRVDSVDVGERACLLGGVYGEEERERGCECGSRSGYGDDVVEL